MAEALAGAEALPVLVVGAGFAGVAAAFAASRAGARVRVATARAGASELYSGIVDGERAGPELVELARALGLALGAEPRAVATREGMVRRARGRDLSLLDLEACAGKTIGVADVGRDDWDAELIAKGLGASAWARETSTRFRCVGVAALRTGAERRISGFDFARGFDEPTRADALGGMLAQASSGVQAWLLGPWLGVEAPSAERVSRAAQVPVGESASSPGGVASARFSLRRAALLAELGIELEVRTLERVQAHSGVLVASFDDGGEVTARAVVLAVGGVASGAIRLAPSRSTPGVRLAFDAPVRLALMGEVLDVEAWLSGPDFRRLGLGALEALGIAAEASFAAAPDQPLYVCGDALAGQPRTALAALATGFAAGRRAAGAR
jgi:monoamine oxidase